MSMLSYRNRDGECYHTDERAVGIVSWTGQL